MLVDLIRLILIILFLPLIIIFAGPLLVLLVFKGQQRVGPITLDSDRYDVLGKAGIFMLGLAMWVFVWGGLIWLFIAAIPLPSQVEQVNLITPSVVTTPLNTDVSATVAIPEATEDFVTTATLTPTPSPIPATLTPTPTPAPPTPTFSPTPTLGPIIPVGGTTPEATLTPTPLFNEVLVTNTPPFENTLVETIPMTTTTPSNSEEIVLTPGDRQAAIDALDQANRLLEVAISLPNEENLQSLAQIWHGQALSGISDFAIELYERYSQPFEARFEYMTPPRIVDQSPAGEIVVISNEKWRYGGPTATDEEAFKFTYTLSRVDDHWMIIQYDFLNLPLPTPTTISLDGTLLEDIYR